MKPTNVKWLLCAALTLAASRSSAQSSEFERARVVHSSPIPSAVYDDPDAPFAGAVY